MYVTDKHLTESPTVLPVQIFSCILNLCSDEAGRIGYREGDTVHFSPFFVCCGLPGQEDSAITPTLVDYRVAFDAVLACLRHVSFLPLVVFI